MELKIKDEYVDTIMSCPFTGHPKHLKFLDKAFYTHWYNKGLTYLFDVIETSEKKNDTKKK